MKTSKYPTLRGALFGALIVSNVVVLSARAQSSTAPDTRATDRPAMNDQSAGANTADAKISWGDKRFLNKAAKSGMEEVAVSRVAAERATNPEVKAMARKIVSDHEKLNSDVMSLAGTRGVSLSDGMQKHDEETMAKWQKKEAGADFDREYVRTMVSDHEDAIELFGKAAKSEDAQVAALAGKALPKLQQHYTHAMELQKMLK